MKPGFFSAWRERDERDKRAEKDESRSKNGQKMPRDFLGEFVEIHSAGAGPLPDLPELAIGLRGASDQAGDRLGGADPGLFARVSVPGDHMIV